MEIENRTIELCELWRTNIIFDINKRFKSNDDFFRHFDEHKWIIEVRCCTVDGKFKPNDLIGVFDFDNEKDWGYHYEMNVVFSYEMLREMWNDKVYLSVLENEIIV